jgi:hypothetical protein
MRSGQAAQLLEERRHLARSLRSASHTRAFDAEARTVYSALLDRPALLGENGCCCEAEL